MSFAHDLTTFLQKYQNTDTLFQIDQQDEKAAKNCINILNQIIKKREKKPRKPKVLRQQEAKLRELREMEKKKLREKMFIVPEIADTIGENLIGSRNCYVCKKRIESENSHAFYNSMCGTCGDFNYAMRTRKRDLTGYTAIVTGGRVKIGYEIALWLLRNNCKTIVTTRFPADALMRFKKDEDYETFKDRLFLYGLDFRDLKKVYQFIDFVQNNYKEVNILINNAAQTIYQTDEYNRQLMQDEETAMKALQEDLERTVNNDELPLIQRNLSTNETQMSLIQKDFPVYDINHIPVDFSTKNSWTKQIDEIDFREFAEAQVINSWVPFILCSQLKKLMTVSDKKSFIINVSSSEGRFYYAGKKSNHPHTNMAKAALNMLTRTCGSAFAKNGIYMTSIDTGWCSEMNPNLKLSGERTVPLDEIDGAMRLVYPIFEDLDLHSVFLRHYKVSSW